MKKAIQINPNYQAAYNNLGNVLKDQGDLTTAIDCFKIAIKLNPEDSGVHYNLGNAHQEQGDLTLAITSYVSRYS